MDSKADIEDRKDDTNLKAFRLKKQGPQQNKHLIVTGLKNLKKPG